MQNVTGPIEIVLLEKDDRKYLLIADRHTPWNEGGCPPSITSEILPEYISSLFRENPQNQWDFYIEQGVLSVDEKQKDKAKFLNRTDLSLYPSGLASLAELYEQDLQKPGASITLTYDYFRSQGCFFIDETSPNKNLPECNNNFSNVRFHLIDTRQANFGQCKVPTLTKYSRIGRRGKLLYSGLFDIVITMSWNTRDELTGLLNEYADNYFNQVNAILKCFEERKLLKQREASVMGKGLDEYFLPTIVIIRTVLEAIKEKMAFKRREIVNQVLLIVDKVIPTKDNYKSLYIKDNDNTNKYDFLGYQIVDELPDTIENDFFGKDYRSRLLQQINSSPYLKISNGVNMNEGHYLDITDVLFECEKLIMDMYALGRMTKPYNKNVVVLAGFNHTDVYSNFLTKNGFKIKWIGNPHSQYPKCITVPSFTTIEPWHRRLGRFLGFRGGKPTTPPQSCCNHTKKAKKCIRKDGKLFSLPRKFTRKQCMEKRKQGYSMKASCAPYKNCKKAERKVIRTRKKRSKSKKSKPPQFLYHPENPDKSFDVYIDKNPKDTIPIKYSSVDDVRETIKKLERLYKAGKYSHKRIWQVGMIMKVRLDAIKKHHPAVKGINQRQKLAEKYFKFLGQRTKTPREKRRKMKFTI